MAGFRLSKAAVRDLLAIGRYTRERWGDEQCRRYLTRLDDRFHVLAAQPEAGRPCDEVRPGYRCVREGRHLIFYRLGTTGVEVIRVLHERMLPSKNL